MLKGKRVALLISEPWEWANEHRYSPPPVGEIIAEVFREDESPIDPIVLVRLDEPFTHKEVLCEYIVVASRHVGVPLGLLLTSESVSANMTRTSEERALSDKPCGDPKWRGGGGSFIGAIRLDPPTGKTKDASSD